jgi:hypothetical protein
MPQVLPEYFGVIPIFALWVVISTVLLSAGTRLYDVAGIPIVTIAIIGVFVLEFFGWSDNHRFRHSEPPAKPVVRASIDDGFAKWLAARKDVSAYKGKKYPIYIVSAEGGGSYAGYHAAKVLSRIQDLCPNFAQHVFAISAVSGGTLGAAVFSALAKEQARNTEYKPCKESYDQQNKKFEKQAEQLLSHDFLSPLIWAGLFPDFVQRFLPVAIYPLDRAVALEKSFEYVWDVRRGGANPFRDSFFALCSPGSDKCSDDVAAPALFINTTNVETGSQLVLSPMFLGYTGLRGTPNIEDFYSKSASINDIPLSTAVGLSSRFPWVLPVGWYEFEVPAPKGSDEKPQRRRMSFVDGGYYEGSGVATAERLARYLLKYVQDSPGILNGVDISIKIIMITGSYQPVDRFYNTAPSTKSYDELTAPLGTLLMAWRARNAAVPTEVEITAQGPYVATSAQFDDDYLPLPVGWQLANLSRNYLEVFTGTPQECQRGRFGVASLVESINNNNCLVRDVIDDLHGSAESSATGSTR